MISDGNETDIRLAAKNEAAKLLQEAKFTADRIIAEANKVASASVKAADMEARQVLADARVWVAEKDAALDKALFGWIGNTVCSSDSKIGDAIDWMLGSARSCYCCAAIRAGIVFGVAGFALGAVLDHIL